MDAVGDGVRELLVPLLRLSERQEHQRDAHYGRGRVPRHLERKAALRLEESRQGDLPLEGGDASLQLPQLFRRRKVRSQEGGGGRHKSRVLFSRREEERRSQILRGDGEDDESLWGTDGDQLPVPKVRADYRRGFHLRGDGEHLRHDPRDDLLPRREVE